MFYILFQCKCILYIYFVLIVITIFPHTQKIPRIKDDLYWLVSTRNVMILTGAPNFNSRCDESHWSVKCIHTLWWFSLKRCPASKIVKAHSVWSSISRLRNEVCKCSVKDLHCNNSNHRRGYLLCSGIWQPWWCHLATDSFIVKWRWAKSNKSFSCTKNSKENGFFLYSGLALTNFILLSIILYT